MNESQDTTQKKTEVENQSAPASALNTAPCEDGFTNFLQQQTQRRTESAEAFQQDTTAEPSMRDLLEEQVKMQRQIRSIKNHLVRVQQGLLVCQFLSVLVAGSLVAIASFVYFRPNQASTSLGMRDHREPLEQRIPGSKQLKSQWPAARAQADTYAIADTQRHMIFVFFQRAKRIKLSGKDDAETRLTKQSNYISLLSDLSAKGEELAEQHARREVCEMLIKVAKYAKENQSFGAETQEQLELEKDIAKFCKVPS